MIIERGLLDDSRARHKLRKVCEKYGNAVSGSFIDSWWIEIQPTTSQQNFGKLSWHCPSKTTVVGRQ